LDNWTALVFAVLILAGLGADWFFEWGAFGFLSQKLVDLIGWLAFWR